MAEKQKAVAKQEKVAISKRDPWALKKWFSVHAPSYLGGVFIAEVPASGAQMLLMRTLEVSLYDLTKDISHLPIKLRFQIHRVDGLRASTRFKGLELTRDHLRSLVRRGTPQSRRRDGGQDKRRLGHENRRLSRDHSPNWICAEVGHEEEDDRCPREEGG
jgi:SSU ribosomal protein S3AE